MTSHELCERACDASRWVAAGMLILLCGVLFGILWKILGPAVRESAHAFRKCLGRIGSTKVHLGWAWPQGWDQEPHGEKPTPAEHGELPQTDDGWVAIPGREVRRMLAGKRAEIQQERADAIENTKSVSVWCYWRIARDGTPTVSICDDPMSHPHTHLVRIPIPEDVQKCVAATKDPPLCMVLGKSSKMLGKCPEPSNETETK